MSSSDNRGLASADQETRERVASKGGSAPHEERGLQAADQETRERVAREGGESHRGGSSSEDDRSTHEKKAEAGRKGGEH